MYTESQPLVPPVDAALPAAFYTDQGALYVRDDAEAMIALAPELLLRMIVAVAERGLHLPQETAAWLTALAPLLRKLTQGEKGAALAALVVCERPAEAIDLAVRLGALSQLLPDFDRMRAMPKRQGLYKDVYAHTLQVVAATPTDLITRLAALLHDVAKPDTLVIEGSTAHFPNHDLLGADRAGRRLRGLCFDEAIAAAVEILVRLHLRANSYEASWTDSAVRRLHLDAGAQWQRLLDLSYADVTSARVETVARARRRVQELADHAAALDRPIEVSPLDGNALMERFGRGPGRWIGDVKHHLIDLVRSGQLDAGDQEGAWTVAGTFLNRDE